MPARKQRGLARAKPLVFGDAVIGGESVDTDRHYPLLMEIIAMLDNQPLFAALDVSLEKTTVCVMSLDGAITKEAIVATDPEAIATCLSDDLGRLERVGVEAGPMSEWLVRGLADLGVSVVLMETRQVRAALSAMIVKTDRKDARGMAHLLRTGWVPAGPRQDGGCAGAEGNAVGTHDPGGPPQGYRE